MKAFELITTPDDDPEYANILLVKTWNGMIMHPDTFLNIYESPKSDWSKHTDAQAVYREIKEECIRIKL